MSEIEISTPREIEYTVHGEKIFLVGFDASGTPFVFYSMNLEQTEGRSLSRKARRVYEYFTGHRLIGMIKFRSVRPDAFFKSYGAMFPERPSEL